MARHDWVYLQQYDSFQGRCLIEMLVCTHLGRYPIHDITYQNQVHLRGRGPSIHINTHLPREDRKAGTVANGTCTQAPSVCIKGTIMIRLFTVQPLWCIYCTVMPSKLLPSHMCVLRSTTIPTLPHRAIKAMFTAAQAAKAPSCCHKTIARLQHSSSGLA